MHQLQHEKQNTSYVKLSILTLFLCLLDAVQAQRCSRECRATLEACKGTFQGYANVDAEADTFTGIGTFASEGGYSFTGEWKDSLQNGDGVEMDVEGNETIGKWAAGTLLVTERTRTLKQVFEDGPAEQIEALRNAGQFTMTKFGFYSWWVFHLSVGIYSVVVAFSNWPASQSVDGTAFATAVVMMCIYLLQLMIYLFFTWHELQSPVQSPPLFYKAFGAKLVLLLTLLLIAAVAVLTRVFEGDRNLPMQTTAKMLLLVANGEFVVLYFVIGMRHQLFRLTPWQRRERRTKAKKAYADGITDYVDSNAVGIQNSVVDVHLSVLGLSFMVWRLNFMLNVQPAKLIMSAKETYDVSHDGSGIVLAGTDDSGFINFDYIGVGAYASCLCAGLFLALTRTVSWCTISKPGHVSKRDMFVPGITFPFIGAIAVATHSFAGTKLLRSSVQLTNMEGFGAALLFSWAWWFTVVFGILFASLWKNRNAGEKYVTDDEKTYTKLWASLKEADILALAKTTDRIMKLKSIIKSPAHRYPHGASRFANFVEVFRRVRLLNPLVDAKSKQWFGILLGRFDNVGTDSKMFRMPAPLKTYQRAIDKIWRSYQGNVDLLVDLTRTAIVCDSLEQVEFLAETFLADKEVSIKRCKNRFHPKYDSTATAGYRDVAFNMKLKSAEAVELGLDGMIFEVQLLIKDVHDVKMGAGHTNYNILRRLKAN
jgi:hypothetical protein